MTVLQHSAVCQDCHSVQVPTCVPTKVQSTSMKIITPLYPDLTMQDMHICYHEHAAVMNDALADQQEHIRLSSLLGRWTYNPHTLQHTKTKSELRSTKIRITGGGTHQGKRG